MGIQSRGRGSCADPILTPSPAFPSQARPGPARGLSRGQGNAQRWIRGEDRTPPGPAARFFSCHVNKGAVSRLCAASAAPGPGHRDRHRGERGGTTTPGRPRAGKCSRAPPPPGGDCANLHRGDGVRGGHVGTGRGEGTRATRAWARVCARAALGVCAHACVRAAWWTGTRMGRSCHTQGHTRVQELPPGQ